MGGLEGQCCLTLLDLHQVGSFLLQLTLTDIPQEPQKYPNSFPGAALGTRQIERLV